MNVNEWLPALVKIIDAAYNDSSIDNETELTRSILVQIRESSYDWPKMAVAIQDFIEEHIELEA